MYNLLKFLPRNHISFLIGALAHIPLPRFLAGVLIRMYCKGYQIDLSEVAQPVESFNCLGQFFVRELKCGVRPVAEGLVSPVDGTLRQSGAVVDSALPQVKGMSYSVESLLEDVAGAEAFNDGTFYSLYLSPSDYHHVHSPVDGQITFCRYIAGDLWPVNDWSIESIESLFSKNERVVVGIETSAGPVIVVLVGATNVGRISISFEKRVSANNLKRILSFPKPAPVQFDYPEKISIARGERLGTFHLGSSVVVLAPKGMLGDSAVADGKAVQYGQHMAKFSV